MSARRRFRRCWGRQVVKGGVAQWVMHDDLIRHGCAVEYLYMLYRKGY